MTNTMQIVLFLSSLYYCYYLYIFFKQTDATHHYTRNWKEKIPSVSKRSEASSFGVRGMLHRLSAEKNQNINHTLKEINSE